MTMCIAWKFGEKFCLGADSRLSGGDTPMDFGIKVLECPIRIISAVQSETGTFSVLHESSVGLAYSGSPLVAYLVKERVAEILSKLQYIGSQEHLTFGKVAEAVFKVYEHAVQAINRAHGGYGHETEFR